jgi:selenide,water dikinase
MNTVENMNVNDATTLRLTQFAPGGGCSSKIPAADLEEMLVAAYGTATSFDTSPFEVLCGLESGDDATVVRIAEGIAIVTTTDFFPPVVDNPFDWGRIAAANALSDVYAMGGTPVSALNLLAWPPEKLPFEIAAEVIRGGRAIAAEAGCVLLGGHSIQDETPLYGLAVTGIVQPGYMLRNDAARAGEPISLTKPLGSGILNNLHKTTGEYVPEAIATMTMLNRDSARAALEAGISAVTDVTGFGLLGHLYKMARASGLTAVVNAACVPYISGAREALALGYVPGGTRRNLAWVMPHLESVLPESELLLLADAQTSGGLLVAGELLGSPIIGEFIPDAGTTLIVR